MTLAHHDFVPAAGRRWLLPLYDPLIALLTREKHWRGEILKSLDLRAGDILVDVGCGTGTLAVMAKLHAPQAQVIGIDPDPDALARARRKATRRGADVEFCRGFGNETANLLKGTRATKIVSSFAFHHMPSEMQAHTLAAMREALVPGGKLRIADFVSGHFGGLAQADLLQRISAAGFDNAHAFAGFRVSLANITLVGGEKSVA